MTNPKFEIIPFENQHILTSQIDGKAYVIIKPIAESMGLSWSGQFERIKRHPIISKGIRVIRTLTGNSMSVMDTPSGHDGQKMVALDLQSFHGWLVTISSERIKDDDVRNLVLRYQENAFKILFEHFHGPINPAGSRNISIGQASEVRRQIRYATQDYKIATTIGEKMVHHALLDSAMGVLGYQAPTIEQLDSSISDNNREIINAFWAAMDILMQHGYNINHSRSNHKIALNLPEIRELLATHRIDLPLEKPMMNALRLSESPEFIGTKTVNSKITQKPINCWVFHHGQYLEDNSDD